jgi:hypothetical protein
LAFGVEALPSVVDGPNVTTAPFTDGFTTSTPSRKNQDESVFAYAVASVSALWSPDVE